MLFTHLFIDPSSAVECVVSKEPKHLMVTHFLPHGSVFNQQPLRQSGSKPDEESPSIKIPV